MQPWMAMRSMSRDSSVAERSLSPGTRRRVLTYAAPYRRAIIAFLAVVVVDSVLVVTVPLLIKSLVDDGVIPKDSSVVVRLSLVVAVIAIADAVLTVISRWYSSRIGEGLINDLRTQVFAHVLRQPIAFFTRAQTGSLVSRLNNDVVGAQQAFTSVLSNVVSNIVSVVLVIAAMLALSWQLTLGSLLLVPLFLIPAKLMGRRLASLAHRQMTLNADMGTRMTERFNVAGALLVKLFGHPAREEAEYAERAGRVRDIGIQIALNRTIFMAALTLVAALATAMIYGFGGVMAVNHALRRHAPGPGRSSRPPLRSPHVAVQRPGRHHDGAHLLRARLRGARPRAARQGASGRRRPARRAPGRRARPRGVPLPVRRRGVARLARVRGVR